MLGRYLARPPFGGKGWIQPDLYTHVLAWFSDALVLRTGACAQLLVLEIPCIDLGFIQYLGGSKKRFLCRY